MSDIQAAPYSNIISKLPVNSHTIDINRKSWLRLIQHLSLNSPLRNISVPASICRNRLLHFQYGNNEHKSLEILMWGYSSGGRGTNITQVLNNLPRVSAAAANHCPSWPLYFNQFKIVPGVGISTITKFAYFFGHSFDGLPALILDQRVADILNLKHWANAPTPVGQRGGWCNQYLKYLNEMNNSANAIKASGEQLELFFYLLGKHF